jgi:hypothetical protein
MKWFNILIIFIALVFMSLMFVAETHREREFLVENYTKPPGIPKLTLNFSSDKEVYRSSEEMELTATIQTETKAENLTVKIYGIKDSTGRFRVKGEKVIGVDPPGKAETFEFRMPSCYGCAGVSPGDYEIVLEVLQNGEIIGNHSLTVKLEG